MKNANKKALRKAVSVFLFLALSVTAAAKPMGDLNVSANSASINDKQDKIKELEERNQQIDNEISKIDADITENEHLQDLYWEKLVTAKDQVDNYNNLIYYKEQDITLKQADIDAMDLQIEAKEEDIKNNEREIDKLEQTNEANLEKFGEILHAMYVTENTDIFSVLADSNDIYDLLVRTKLMVNISQQNQQFMNEIKQSMADARDRIAKLEDDKRELNDFRTRLVDEKAQLEADKVSLEEERSNAKNLSDEYNNNYNYYSGVITNFENRQEQLENERQANSEEIAEYEKQIQREIQLAQQNSTQSYQEGDWIWPLDLSFHYLTTKFGYDPWRGGNHSGIDVGDGGINGAPIYASKAGTVITAKDSYIPGYSYGKYVVIDHGNGYSTLYGHCSALYVSVGQTVNQGDAIAAVGSTGWSTGPHLHFEVRIDGIAQDPLGYVRW